MAHKYCKATTASHSCSTKHKSCLEKLSILLKNEGQKTSPQCYDEAEVLNLDKVVKEVKQVPTPPSCDFMMGVAKDEKDKKIVLAECKFNVSPKNFDLDLKKEILAKVNESKKLLGHEPSFWHEVFILVQRGCLQEVGGRLTRLFSNQKPELIPIDINSFETKFFK